MKKLLVSLFIFGALTIGVHQVNASVLSDALLQIENLKKEILQLKSSIPATVVDSSILTTPTSDLTPRISYYSGKVNQHVDIASKAWQSDPDGSSGSSIDKLTYCKKWYPNTTSVVDYKTETINSWHDSGNKNNYTSTRLSYKCVSDVIFTTPTLKTTADISSSTASAFITASIVGSSLNKEVSYWKLLISCDAGVVVSSSKPDLCGTEIRMDTYNMANPLEDYLLLTAGAKNNSSFSSKLILSLSSFNSMNIKIREDKKEIILPSSSTTTSSIKVISPNGGETYKVGDNIVVKWTSSNIAGNLAEINLVPSDMKFGSYLTFDKNIPNTGSYTMNISNLDPLNNYFSLGKNFKVNVIGWSSSNQLIEDSSDNLFTINSTSSVICTNGATNYPTCTIAPTTPSITVRNSNTNPVDNNILVNTGARVLYFDVLADNYDVNINSVKVNFENKGKSSIRLSDYIDQVTIFNSSSIVSSSNVSDFVKNGNIYSKIIALDSSRNLIQEGNTKRFEIYVKTKSLIDNTNLDNLWFVTVNGVRYTASDGYVSINTTPITNTFKVVKTKNVTGCSKGEIYSSTTGALCLVPSTLPVGCTATSKFSSTTGVVCSAPLTLPIGCTTTSGFSSITGASCSAISTLPVGCTSTSKFSSVTGASCYAQ